MHTLKTLEDLIIALAPKHHATYYAPSNFEDLMAFKDCIRPENDCSLPVYNGGCDNTIWSRPAVNHAFRAWHDAIHIQLEQDFSVLGETLVCQEHIKQIALILKSPQFNDLLWCEIVGQVYHYQIHKQYVLNQDKFVSTLLKHGVKHNNVNGMKDLINKLGTM